MIQKGIKETINNLELMANSYKEAANTMKNNNLYTIKKSDSDSYIITGATADDEPTPAEDDNEPFNVETYPWHIQRETTAADAALKAGIETGHIVICSIPKPEPEPMPEPMPEPEPTTAADTPTSEKNDTPTVKKFEVGKSYYCRSFCDYDCIFTIDIIERKGNKITLKSWDNSIRKKIVKVDNDGVEWFRYDRYSMAPIYRANKETAPEDAIKKEVETTTAADDIAAVYELHPVTVTAAAVTDTPAAPSPAKKLAAPSPVKKLAAPSPVKNAVADAVTPAGQKTASDIATATAPAADDADSLTTAPAANGLQPTPPDGLTICAGTAWAYTMMNWA